MKIITSLPKKPVVTRYGFFPIFNHYFVYIIDGEILMRLEPVRPGESTEERLHILMKDYPDSTECNPLFIESFKDSVLDYITNNRPPLFSLYLAGTEFQINVWKALTHIPHGKTITYSGLAGAIGNEKAVRAVASAVAANPISIFIPCHRVIPADLRHRPGNYQGGFSMKKELLSAENADIVNPILTF